MHQILFFFNIKKIIKALNGNIKKNIPFVFRLYSF